MAAITLAFPIEILVMGVGQILWKRRRHSYSAFMGDNNFVSKKASSVNFYLALLSGVS